jgi:hypothetical protein
MAKKARRGGVSYDDSDEDEEGWVEDTAVAASGAKAAGERASPPVSAAIEGATYKSAIINTSEAFPESESHYPQVEVTHEKCEAASPSAEQMERFLKNRGLWHELHVYCVQADEVARQDAVRKAARTGTEAA